MRLSFQFWSFLTVVSWNLPRANCARAHERPNIILVVLDDSGYGDIGSTWNLNAESNMSHTPFIDKLASQGLQFTDFSAGASICTPSRAALLTGRYGLRTGIVRHISPFAISGLPPSEITIARALKHVGYRTAMIGKWHLGHTQKHQPTSHGFDQYLGIPYSNDMGCTDPGDGPFGLPRHVTKSCSAQQPSPRRAPRRKQQIALPLYHNNKVVESPTDLWTLTEKMVQFAEAFISGKDTPHRSRNGPTGGSVQDGPTAGNAPGVAVDDEKKKPFFLYAALTEPHVPHTPTSLLATPKTHEEEEEEEQVAGSLLPPLGSFSYSARARKARASAKSKVQDRTKSDGASSSSSYGKKNKKLVLQPRFEGEARAEEAQRSTKSDPAGEVYSLVMAQADEVVRRLCHAAARNSGSSRISTSSREEKEEEEEEGENPCGGRAANTLTIVTSDNGPWREMGRYGGHAGPFSGGKFTSFEGGLRVFAVFHWPGRILPRPHDDLGGRGGGGGGGRRSLSPSSSCPPSSSKGGGKAEEAAALFRGGAAQSVRARGGRRTNALASALDLFPTLLELGLGVGGEEEGEALGSTPTTTTSTTSAAVALGGIHLGHSSSRELKLNVLDGVSLVPVLLHREPCEEDHSHMLRGHLWLQHYSSGDLGPLRLGRFKVVGGGGKGQAGYQGQGPNGVVVHDLAADPREEKPHQWVGNGPALQGVPRVDVRAVELELGRRAASTSSTAASLLSGGPRGGGGGGGGGSPLPSSELIGRFSNHTHPSGALVAMGRQGFADLANQLLAVTRESIGREKGQ